MKASKTTIIFIFSLLTILIGMSYQIFQENKQTASSIIKITSPLPTPSYPLKINYVGTIFSPPKNLNTYTYQSQNIDTLSQLIIDSLNLFQQKKNIPIWENEKYSLITIRELNAVQLSSKQRTMNTNAGIELEKIQSVLEIFFQQLNLPKPQIIYEKIYTFSDSTISTDTNHAENSPLNETRLIRVPYKFLLGDLPFLQKSNTTQDMYAVINSNYDIINVVLSPTFSITNTSEIIPINLEQALDQIANNNFIFINHDDHRNAFNKITSLKLNTPTLEYRTNDIDSKISPYYNFVGKAQSSQGEFEVELITPASLE